MVRTRNSNHDFGIPLDRCTEAKIKLNLSRLKEKAPYHSSVELNFFDEGYKTRGSLIIRTLDKVFKSIKFSQNPLTLYHALEEDIEFQLAKWKKNRFQPQLMTNFKPKQLAGGI